MDIKKKEEINKEMLNAIVGGIAPFSTQDNQTELVMEELLKEVIVGINTPECTDMDKL